MNVIQILNNPMFKSLITSKNPYQFLMNQINQNPQLKNNEIIQNALRMYQNGDEKGLETLGRNITKESGMNADEMFNLIKNIANNH